jgi:CubicO group peptidase (beta-lactamase class C family)
VLAAACAASLTFQIASPEAQQHGATREPAVPALDWFTAATGGDRGYYPPLPQGTDLLEWYRNSAQAVDPVGSGIRAEEPSRREPASRTVSPDGPTFTSGGKAFDVRRFEQEIHARMDGKALGYSYAINFQKQLYVADGWGLERNIKDGLAWHDGYRRMNIASISKTLTAVAILQLLEKNELTIDEPVGPWLPAEWNKAYGFGSPAFITFRDLLTHRSGLKQTVTAIEAFDAGFKALDKVTWDGLEAVVAYGTIPAYYNDPKPAYSNINFALFRVIIPALWKATGEMPWAGELNAGYAAILYATYMAEHLFIPLGIHQASCSEDQIGNPIRYYNFFEPIEEGAVGGNWALSCGSGGWYLSAYNLANLMANIRYNDAILSPAMRSLMDQHKLGWSYSWSQNGMHGLYLAHAGALYFDDEDFGERREMQGCVMKYPIHVEAVLLVNSSIETNTLPCAKLAAAFDAAWVD